MIYCLRYSDCEIGLAFDGDGDRLGVVSKSGQIIWPDRQLILFARDVLSRNPGAEIIYDVKCSRHVARAITEAGGKATMWKTGHSLIKAKMRETGALLAGEMSGHLFFKERWYGFDDGLYAAARLLEILSAASDPSAMLEGLPQSCATPEIKLETAEGEQFALVERCARKADFPARSRSTIWTACGWITSTASAWRGRPTPRRRSCCVSKGTRWPPWRASRRTSATPCVASRLMSVYRSKEHYAMDRAEFAREEAQAAGLLDCAEWRAFDHAARCAELDAGALKLIEAAGLSLDLSMQRQSPALEAAGLALLRARGVPRAVQALFAGEAVNWTEDKPAWHTALRAGRTREQPDGQDAGSVCEYARMLDFVRALDQEADIGAVLHIGIGGSDWGRGWRCRPLAAPRSGVRSVSFRISTAMRSTTR